MSEIDFSKAPEGATHYRFLNHLNWYAYDAGGSGYVWDVDEWILLKNTKPLNEWSEMKPIPSEKAPVVSDKTTKSDGSTASYYELPEGASELQHLISHRNMNAQIGEIFRACYRYGLVEHSEMIRDAKKIKFYAEAEIARLEKLK